MAEDGPVSGDVMPVGKGPARRYSWPPFVVDNGLALRHGAYSGRRVTPIMAELVTGVLELAGEPGSTVAYLSEQSYRPALEAWARAEARCQLLTEYLMRRVSSTAVW